MESILSTPHRVARYNYAPRTVAFALSFLVFGSLWIERGRFNAWEILFAVLTFLVYPHLAYLHARIAVDSKRAELNNLYADSLLLGASTALIHFAAWPSVMLLSAICLNSAGYGYIGRLFRSLALFVVGAGISGALVGYDFRPDAGPIVAVFTVFGILAYVSWAGAVSYIQNKNLVHARNALKTSEEQFRFIAENVGDMVSVLDLRGRFRYASSSYSKCFGPNTVGPGADWLVHVYPEDREDAKLFLNSIAASASRNSILLRLASANGSWRFMDCQGNPVRDDAGKIMSIVVVSHDIAATLGAGLEDYTNAAQGIRAREFVAGLRNKDTRLLAQRRAIMSETPQFHSMDEIRAYVRKEVERQLVLDREKSRVRRTAKQGILLAILVVVYLQYYFLDIVYQALTLPTLEVSVPMPRNQSNTHT